MKKERKLVLLMAVMVLSITMFSCKMGINHSSCNRS